MIFFVEQLISVMDRIQCVWYCGGKSKGTNTSIRVKLALKLLLLSLYLVTVVNSCCWCSTMALTHVDDTRVPWWPNNSGEKHLWWPKMVELVSRFRPSISTITTSFSSLLFHIAEWTFWEIDSALTVRECPIGSINLPAQRSLPPVLIRWLQCLPEQRWDVAAQELGRGTLPSHRCPLRSSLKQEW